MDLKNLIESVIQQLANNESISLMTTKLQVISRLLKNEEFKSWIDKEFIFGYGEESEIPEYRKVTIIGMYASFLKPKGFGSYLQYSNHEIPLINLGVEKYNQFSTISILQTVSSLDQILIGSKGNIHLSLIPSEKLLVQQQILMGCEISEIRKDISRECFLNIINKAKANLLELFIELNETVFENEINFNIMDKKADISQIVNNTINTGIYVTENSTANINESNVVGGSNNTIKFSPDFKHQVTELLTKIEELSKDIEGDRDDIAFEIANIKLHLSKGESALGIKSAFHAISGIASSVAADQITALINKTLPMISFSV